MDPDAALRDIIDAATAGDTRVLLERAADLARWLDAGGFPPRECR